MSSLKPLKRHQLSRRTFLRGAGGAMLALPALECMLNSHGTALAQGQALPKRFGVWFWGNGVRLESWTPDQTGAGYALSSELQPLQPVKNYINVVTNYRVRAAGPRGHHGGEAGMLSGVEFIPLDPGSAGYSSQFGGPSIDQILVNDLHPDKPALVLGVSRRVVTGEGPTLQFISHRGPTEPVAPERSPAALYTRLFGSFTPPDGNDPRNALRASVLDAVREETTRLQARLGTSDRQRLDAHLTAVSEIRQRILQLPPEYIGACEELPPITDTNQQDGNGEPLRVVNDIFSDMVTMAFACDLHRSVSVMFTGSVGGTVFREIGSTRGHHDLTHDPSTDAQNQIHLATIYTMERFSSLLQKLQATPEGAGNLLDQSLFLGTSDLAEGLSHSNEDYPVVLAGRAGGAMRFPGVHHRGGANNGTRNTNDVLNTILRAMGSSRTSIGVGNTRSDQAVTEVMAG